MQIAVRLGRETGVNLQLRVFSQILVNNIVNKIAGNCFFHFSPR